MELRVAPSAGDPQPQCVSRAKLNFRFRQRARANAAATAATIIKAVSSCQSMLKQTNPGHGGRKGEFAAAIFRRVAARSGGLAAPKSALMTNCFSNVILPDT